MVITLQPLRPQLSSTVNPGVLTSTTPKISHLPIMSSITVGSSGLALLPLLTLNSLIISSLESRQGQACLWVVSLWLALRRSTTLILQQEECWSKITSVWVHKGTDSPSLTSSAMNFRSTPSLATLLVPAKSDSSSITSPHQTAARHSHTLMSTPLK